MIYALDTNCLLRWLLNDQPTQSKIVSSYLKSSASRVHVADLVLAEVAWVLKSFYKLDDHLVEGFLRKVVEHENINCNRVLFNKVLDDYNTSPKVSFVDLCLAHYAGLADAKLLTFDKALAKKLPRVVELAG